MLFRIGNAELTEKMKKRQRWSLPEPWDSLAGIVLLAVLIGLVWIGDEDPLSETWWYLYAMILPLVIPYLVPTLIFQYWLIRKWYPAEVKRRRFRYDSGVVLTENNESR
jgi:hypothetical protein